MGKLRNISQITGGAVLDTPFPAGVVVPYAGSSVPSGWLLCDGSVVSQTTYSTLFTGIGTTFNTGGEGVGNFRLPDLRQKFILGKAASGTGAVLGETGGTVDHTHSIPAHYHALGIGADLNITSSGTHTTALDHDHSSFTSGAGSAHTHANTLGTSGGSPHTHANTLGTSGGSPHTHAHTLATDTSANHTHSIDHDHSSFTSGAGSAHTHSIDHDHGSTATSTDGSHFHFMCSTSLVTGTSVTKTSSQVGFYGSFSASGGDVNYAYDLQGDGGANVVRTSTDGSHNHTLDLPNFTGTSGSESAHTHSIDVPNFTGSSGSAGSHSHALTGSITNESSHTHTITGSITNESSHTHTITGTITNESAHTHPVDVPSFTGSSSSDGSHTHNAGSFSGRVGLVTGGVDGNSAMISGTSNPPYCALNYLIKY